MIPSWQNLQSFLVVARCNSLRQAADLSGVSAATLSRHMKALERSIGQTLFSREASGFTLTETGMQVQAIAEHMDLASQGLQRILGKDMVAVQVAAGAWMTQFLARHMLELRLPEDDFVFEWVAGTSKADIARRHAHIGIRNSRPMEPLLAGRRLTVVNFAVYVMKDSARKSNQRSMQDEWLVVQNSNTPSAMWVDRQLGNVVARVNEPTLLLPLLHADVGMAVLPCFAGDSDSRLERSGDCIDELSHDQWLVAHHEDRHLSSVRTAIDRIVALVGAHQCLFKGTRSTNVTCR